MTRRILILLSVLLASGHGVLETAEAAQAAEPTAAASAPALLRHLPRDPVFVLALFDTHPAERWDQVLALGERFLPGTDTEEMKAHLAKTDETLGVSLREDLLARIGPEVALVLDLPAVDETVQNVMLGEASSEQILGGIGILARVSEAEEFESSVRRLFAKSEAAIARSKGLTRVRWPLDSGSSASNGEAAAASAMPITHLDLFFGTADGLFAAGFDEGFVRASLAGHAPEASLASGADFGRVFGQLDARPQTLTYLNIPRIAEMIRTSAMASGFMQASEEAQPFLEFLESPELTGVGVGSTSVAVEGGTRTTTFGPAALSGGTAQAGIVAAIVIPNFLEALDKAKQKRTMGDMQTVAAALEEHSNEDGGYPGPTDGWVPLASVAVDPSWVTEDGWGNPIWYSSNGGSYRLLSHGKDGVQDETGEDEIASGTAPGFAADILYFDGGFVQ